MDEKVRIGYMDKVDFEFKLGEALGGNMVFPSIKDLKEHRKCSDECGIVEVEVRLRSVVEPGTIMGH
jgi:hypothetical protein